MQQPLILPANLGQLEAVSSKGEGLKADLCEQKTLSVKFRIGGERCQPKGRQHSHSLKNLLQEQGIPPWQRERMPLLSFAAQLVHVAGLWDCEPFTAAADEAGIIVKWRR
jgi:tRNA(Ile)-lysidine synthase